MAKDDEELRKELRKKTLERRRLARRRKIYVLSGFLCLSLLAGVLIGWALRGLFIREPIDLGAIVAPEWVERQFLTKNEFSRPGIKICRVNDIVVHYVGNAGTSAQQNRDYFESLKSQTGENTTSVSSNFVIGLDGEIIQCIPIDEKAYASNNRNSDTISIECCHPDAGGGFTHETYESLVKLVSWLCDELDLSEKNVIRHYDVTGKECPKYYVEHEDAWKRFLEDVKSALK